MMMRCLLVLAFGLLGQACAETSVYVAAEAAGGGDGSREKPFQTLTQARDSLRAARQAGKLKADEAVT